MRNPDSATLVAADLGAESGRLLRGRFSNGRIHFEEIHRFMNRWIRLGPTQQWDFPYLLSEVIAGLGRLDEPPDAFGVATWGVDYGLVGHDGALVSLPVCYRDGRSGPMITAIEEKIGREELFRSTGVQPSPVNTIYQLAAAAQDQRYLLEAADAVLLMPDLINHLLGGDRYWDWTNASTTGLLRPGLPEWNDEVFEQLRIPRRLVGEITPPGHRCGQLAEDVAAQCGWDKSCPLITVAGHDTASAIAAVPRDPDVENWAYLSSGTWSILGAELDHPVLSLETLNAGFTNEIGLEGTTRLLCNMIGLWIIQRCRGEWADSGEEFSYAELTNAARESSQVSLLNVEHPDLFNPPSMLEALSEQLTATGQPLPRTPGDWTRSILTSLAFRYRETLENLDRLLSRKTERLYIVGGGSKNDLLCQLTADATGVPVVAGPSEATAIGNLLVQAMALGLIDSLDMLRQVVLHSTELRTHEPGQMGGDADLNALYMRYRELTSDS